MRRPSGRSTTVAGTGDGWTGTRSHILAADLIEGQREDRRLVPAGWSEAGFDDSGWAGVRPASYGYDNLVASPAPPVRAVRELRPVAVTTLDRGGQVFDLGQNINGRVRLTNLGPAGSTRILTHAEALDATGDVTTDHLRPVAVPFVDRELRAGTHRRGGPHRPAAHRLVRVQRPRRERPARRRRVELDVDPADPGQ